jgi:hypothetical protein
MENIINDIALIYVLHSGRNKQNITKRDLILSSLLVQKYKLGPSNILDFSHTVDCSNFIKSNHQCPICSLINQLIKYNHT